MRRCGHAGRVFELLGILAILCGASGCNLATPPIPTGEVLHRLVRDADTGEPAHGPMAAVWVHQSNDWHGQGDPDETPVCHLEVERVSLLDPLCPALPIPLARGPQSEEFIAPFLVPYLAAVRRHNYVHLLFSPDYELQADVDYRGWIYPSDFERPTVRSVSRGPQTRMRSGSLTRIDLLQKPALWSDLQRMYKRGENTAAIAVICRSMIAAQGPWRRVEGGGPFGESGRQVMRWCEQVAGADAGQLQRPAGPRRGGVEVAIYNASPQCIVTGEMRLRLFPGDWLTLAAADLAPDRRRLRWWITDKKRASYEIAEDIKDVRPHELDLHPRDALPPGFPGTLYVKIGPDGAASVVAVSVDDDRAAKDGPRRWVREPPSGNALTQRIEHLIATIDQSPDPLHGDMTPSVHELIRIGEPAVAPCLDLMLVDSWATRLHAMTVISGVSMRAYGFGVCMPGWPSRDEESEWRELWHSLGDLDCHALADKRAQSVLLWRHWLATGELRRREAALPKPWSSGDELIDSLLGLFR